MCYATFSQYSLAYDQMINAMEDRATRTWSILDHEFELAENYVEEIDKEDVDDDDSTSRDQPWLAEELLERVFG